MRRIVLPILSLMAIACSKEIDEVNLEEFNEEIVATDNPDDTAYYETPEASELNSTNTPPVFDQQTFTIAEHSAAGSSIGFLTATDANDDQITYSLVSNVDIVIDEKTGQLKAGDDLKLDFETDEDLVFTISAFDGKTATEKTFKLDIEDVDEVTLLTDAQKNLIDYFQYITFWKGPGHTPKHKVQKWESGMKLYLDGTISANYDTCIETILEQYNGLFENSDFSISLTNNEAEANAKLFYGTAEEVKNVWPDMYEIIKGGRYSGYTMTPSQHAVMKSTRIWISNPIEVLLTHELGHALGFGHSNKCDDEKSFLCSQISSKNEILPVEADIIRYQYHEDILAGMSEAEVENVLANLILNEI